MDKKLEKMQLRTNTSIEYMRLKKEVDAGHLAVPQARTFLAEYVWKEKYPDRDKADQQVLSFIHSFVSFFPSEEQNNAVCEIFSSGYCYYFAAMLKEAFQRGTVSWCAPYGHICWVDENGTPYDIYGICDSECVYFIPVSYIQEGLADFKHIPGEGFGADEAYIKQAVSQFESDLIASTGVITALNADNLGSK